MSQEHFDHLADSYDDVFPPHVWQHYLKKRVRFFKKLLSSGKILDFGCGTGVLGECLLREGFEVHGVDYSAGMLEKAKARGLQVKVSKNEIPYDDNTFDFVYSVAVFHHLETKENVVNAIKEMVRVTRPGGIVLIWDHNPLNPYWKFLMPRLPQDHGDERLVPLSEATESLKQAGVKKIRFKRSGWLPEFAPAWSMPAMIVMEKILETIFPINVFSAHNVIWAEKPPLAKIN